MRTRNLFTLNNFSGGLNDKYSPFALAPGEFTVLTNWHLNNRGQLVRRNGSAKIITGAITSTPAVQGLAQITTPWVLRRLLVVANGKIYYQEGTENSWTEITADLTLTAGQNVPHNIIQGLGALIGVDSTNAPWKWSYQPTQYTSTDESITFNTSATGADQELAQGFKTDYAEDVEEVGLKLHRVGSPAGNMQVQIATDSSGPSTQVSDWSTAIDCSTFSSDTNGDWVWFDVPTASITGATQYYVRIKTTGYTKDPGTTEVNLNVDQSSPGYPYGQVMTYNGSAWSNYSTASDAGFQIRVGAKALGGSPPTKPKCVAPYHNVVFLGNVEVSGVPYPSRAYWCDLGALETWPSNYNNDFMPEDGGEIRAMFPFGEHLIVFKDTSIHRCTLAYTGETGLAGAFHFHTISTEFGCMGPNAVVSTGDALYFADRRGLCKMDLELIPRYIGEKVETFWESIDDARKEYICSGHDRARSHVWFAVSYGSGQTTNNRIIVYNYQRKAFSIYQGITANALCTYLDSNGKEWLATGDYAGLVLKQDTGSNDNGIGMTATATTGFMDLGNPQLYKLFEQFAVEGTSDGASVVNFSVNINRGDLSYTGAIPGGNVGLGSFILGTSQLGITTGAFTYGYRALYGRGRRIQITLTSESASNPPTIGMMSIFYKPLAVRG